MRFPGFEGEWESKKLDKVATVGRGKSKHRPRDASFLFGGTYPFIQTGDIKKADLFLENYTQTYSDEGLKQSKLWHEDTLCITIAANIAETAILKIKACFPDSIIGLIPEPEHATVLFVKYSFDRFKVDIQKLSQGVAQDNLNIEKLSNLKFFFPSIAEQKKISNLLRLIDERISTQNKIIEDSNTLLKNISKGLLSGSIKFNDASNSKFENWRIVQIGDVLKIGSGRDYKHLQSGEIPVFGTGGLMTYVNDYLYEGETICIGRKGTIDKPFFFKGKVWTVDTLFYTHSFKGVSPKYIFYVFQAINWKQYNEASGVPSLSKSTIEKIEINIPAIPEQHKIAQVLSSIDKKINLERIILGKLQDQKKYFLKKLFI